MHENTLLNLFNSTIKNWYFKGKCQIRQWNWQSKSKVREYWQDSWKDQTRRNYWRFVTKAKKKLPGLEELRRGNNLCFDGFQEETSKTWEESESIITDFVKEKWGIKEDISIIERAYHGRNIQINKRTRNKKEKCLNFKDKSRILNAYRQKMLLKKSF